MSECEPSSPFLMVVPVKPGDYVDHMIKCDEINISCKICGDVVIHGQFRKSVKRMLAPPFVTCWDCERNHEQ